MLRPQGLLGARHEMRTAAMSAATPILAIEDVDEDFDGLRAVAGASFDVARGSITALIGPNGAGKTTMFDLVSGFAAPDRGAIRFDGPAHRRAAAASHRPASAWCAPSS